MTNDMNHTTESCERGHDDYRQLSASQVLAISTSIFVSVTLIVGMLGSRLPNTLSPVAFLLFPFIPAIIFPFAAIPLALVSIAVVAVAIRKGSLPALAATAVTVSIINGIGLRLYLNYLAVPT